MKKILDLFSDPVWVFSSIVFAFLVNFASALAKERFDDFSRNLSSASKKKKAEREASIDRMALALRGRVEERVHLQFMQTKAMLRGSFVGVLGAVGAGVSMSSIVSYEWIIGALSLTFSGYFLWSSTKDIRIYNFLEEVLVRSLRESSFWKEANKAPEPTPGPVTPRASEGASK
jgi:hypothetical protein